MLLSLTMKVGEIGYGQYGRTAARRSAEQRGHKRITVPLGSERPCNVGSFGSLQVLMCGAEANRAASGDRSQPQAHFKLQSKNFFYLSHGLCSREHNPCNVPSPVMWPACSHRGESGGSAPFRQHN